MSGKIAMVLSGFPRRSETFALNEVWALERRSPQAAERLRALVADRLAAQTS